MNREIPQDFVNSLDPKLLPGAPGHNWLDPAFRKSHNKRQVLSNEWAGKYAVPSPASKSGPQPLPETIQSPSAIQICESKSAAEEGRSDALSRKTFVSLEDKMLRFYGYFSEEIRESPFEKVRHRPVSIIFFPHDETFLVQEPRFPNSGLPGGTILKRQKVVANPRQREAFPDDEYVSVNHLNVGINLTLYGTTYTITRCDDATREFLRDLGVDVNPDTSLPVDNFMKKHQDRLETIERCEYGVLPQERGPELADVIRSQRFIRDSGKVLRYFGFFDDQENCGHHRQVEVLYFIEDDTMSITERQSSNEAVPTKFLSRRRLPKDGRHAKAVELTFYNRVNGQREVDIGDPAGYYHAQDLQVGLTLHLYGRDVFLYDCDDTTREYMEATYGIVNGPPIDVSHIKVSTTRVRPTLPIPPPTGFGTHEDSLASCKSLALKAPKGVPMDPNSRNDVLRFEMKLHNPDRSEDRIRVFTLSYYLDDGEIMVTETALRNSGFTGGKFIRKQKLRKAAAGVVPVFYKLEDLTMGNVIDVNSFKFIITDCDLHTKNYLANPQTNGVSPERAVRVTKDRLLTLLSSLRGFLTVRYVTVTEAFRAFDQDRDGIVTLQELHTALKSHLITHLKEEAVAILHQLSSGNAITHKEFFDWMSKPIAVCDDEVDTTATIGTLSVISGDAQESLLRNKVLKQLKERLEGRCMNGFEMFRLASNMPRAYKGRRAEVGALTNPNKDVFITPVQLRRCVDEVLGLHLTEPEMGALLRFFFPLLSPTEYYRRADHHVQDSVDLPLFQSKFNEMSAVGQLRLGDSA